MTNPKRSLVNVFTVGKQIDKGLSGKKQDNCSSHCNFFTNYTLCISPCFFVWWLWKVTGKSIQWLSMFMLLFIIIQSSWPFPWTVCIKTGHIWSDSVSIYTLRGKLGSKVEQNWTCSHLFRGHNKDWNIPLPTSPNLTALTKIWRNFVKSSELLELYLELGESQLHFCMGSGAEQIKEPL